MKKIQSLQIAMIQINPTVGDLKGNAQLIKEHAVHAASKGAELIIFPELALVGYPPRDLLDRPAFIDDIDRALTDLVSLLPRESTVLVGFVHKVEYQQKSLLKNAIAVIHQNKIVKIIHKQLLPNYDVFDEMRWFESGDGDAVFQVGEVTVGLTICEDAWAHVASPLITRDYPKDPIANIISMGAQIIVNVAASPWTVEKWKHRSDMFALIAKKSQKPFIFVNQVGGQDDLIFDGRSTLFDEKGQIVSELQSFKEDSVVVSLEEKQSISVSSKTEESVILDALILGVRDFVRRSNVSGVVLGLSGGIDSAVVASIASMALGSEHVLGIAMPTQYSSQHSLDDAKSLASALGIKYDVISIDHVFKAHHEQLSSHLDKLGQAKPNDVTFENIQARLRGLTLMAIANRLGFLLLNTGNKSEVAVGYCTLYGDMAGGLAVISDVWKTMVYRLAYEINRRFGSNVIPQSTLTKAPSAELKPDQKDSDSLPEYNILDPILKMYIEDEKSVPEIAESGFDHALVKHIVNLIYQSEHKRRQMPPGLIISRKAFSLGRRMPITQAWRG